MRINKLLGEDMIISIIIPCFNEEDTIHLYYSAMESVRTQMQEDFEYIFINDGSSDNTLEVLRDLSTATENVSYLSFSRNFGKVYGRTLQHSILY